MATPTEKSPALEELMDSLNPSGRKRVDSIKANICVSCGKHVAWNEFKDELSRKEYTISGLCQACQDKVFGE